jgi:hypothetical protein
MPGHSHIQYYANWYPLRFDHEGVMAIYGNRDSFEDKNGYINERGFNGSHYHHSTAFTIGEEEAVPSWSTFLQWFTKTTAQISGI